MSNSECLLVNSLQFLSQTNCEHVCFGYVVFVFACIFLPVILMNLLRLWLFTMKE